MSFVFQGCFSILLLALIACKESPEQANFKVDKHNITNSPLDVDVSEAVRISIKWSYKGISSEMKTYEPAVQRPLQIWKTASVKNKEEAPISIPLKDSSFYLSPGGHKTFVLGMKNNTDKPIYFFASPHQVHPPEHTLGFKFKCLCINHAFSVNPHHFWYRVVRLSLSKEFRGDQMKITHDLIGIDEARKMAFESNQQESHYMPMHDKNYIQVHDSENVKVVLKYATNDNFMKRNLYGNFDRCYLHRVAHRKFEKTKKILARDYPKLSFILFDCLRPRRVQRKMWDMVKGTPQQSYVGNPDKGSVHNFGFALDLSLLDANRKELDMGTPYDDFTRLSEPRREKEFLRKKKLTEQQVNNRLILRRVMTQSGFQMLANEWWHFDALDKSIVRRKYKIFE